MRCAPCTWAMFSGTVCATVSQTSAKFQSPAIGSILCRIILSLEIVLNTELKPAGKTEPAYKSIASLYIESTSKAVSLTDEQKKAITAVFEERERSSKDFESKNAGKIKEVSEALVAAYRSMDKEAIEKATKAREELYAPSVAFWKKSQADLNNLLTPEQHATLKEHQLVTSVQAMTRPAILTDEQWKKIRSARKGAQATDWQATGKVLEETLTIRQKEAIANYRLKDAAKLNYQGIKFTAEQSKTIDDTCDALVQGHSKIGLDPKMWNKLAEKINGLLTAEQKDELKKARARTAWNGTGKPTTKN
jgi:Spy/CpxP family protein refolding chaperone